MIIASSLFDYYYTQNWYLKKTQSADVKLLWLRAIIKAYRLPLLYYFIRSMSLLLLFYLIFSSIPFLLFHFLCSEREREQRADPIFIFHFYINNISLLLLHICIFAYAKFTWCTMCEAAYKIYALDPCHCVLLASKVTIVLYMNVHRK